MSLRALVKRLIGRRTQLSVLSALSIAFLVATLAVTSQVYWRLDDYAVADSDNIQWTLTQLEVDHAKLQTEALRLTHEGATALPDLQRRFDALYSRTQLLCEGPVYVAALKGSEVAPELERLQNDLDALLPLMDGPEEVLLRSGPDLSAAMATLAEPVKTLSTYGIRLDAQRREAERGALTSKLGQLAVLSLLMLVALISLLALLWQLYRLYRGRALSNRATLNRLSTILNTSQDAIIVVAPDGSVVDANRAADMAFGLRRADGSLKHVNEILMRPDETGEPQPVTGRKLLGSCAEGPNRCANLLAKASDGRLFPVEMSADLANRSGNEVCICFLRDISRRVADQAEIEAARDRAVAGEQARARFLGMVSHEMRTPLNGMLGALDLLDETGLTREQSQYCRIMKISGQQLLTQINDALDFTQAGSGKLSLNIGTFDLDALLHEAADSQSMQAEAHDTRLRVAPSGQRLGLVDGDRARVLQVLVNLISNAVKFTRQGEVTIDATRPDPDGDIVEVQVMDTGIGIAEDDLPKVFDDFVRLDDKNGQGQATGTGLGLGIVREVVTVMGGQYGVDSIAGDGSLFWVTLPLPRAATTGPSPEASHDRAAPPAAPCPLNILVVEDNGTNRTVLMEMLRKDGHTTLTAPDGETAVKLAEGRAFDLILMDIRMPGIDGVEAARRIRAGQGPSRKARIVFLTAHIRSEDEPCLRAAGAEAILAKPLRLSVLRDLVAGRRKNANDFSIRNSTEGPQMQRMPPVDDEVIQQLRDILQDESFDSFLARFIEEGDRFAALVPSALSSPKPSLVQQVHDLAGSAAVCGAKALQSTLGRAETALTNNDMKTAQALLSQVPDLWRRTRAELHDKKHAA